MTDPRVPTLLECSPEEGARRLAIGWIDDATSAVEKVVAGEDGESLHDTRVALRKLRTVLRTYRRALRGALSKKRIARLKELAASTGEARDAEVQLAWTQSAIEELDEGSRGGGDWLRDELESRKESSYASLRAKAAPALLELLPKLRRDLSRYTTEHIVLEAPERRSFADVTAELITEQARELESTLRHVGSSEDEALAHEARIHGKRLRYLLEPLREHVEDAREVVKTLKRLQDLLGELHDIAVRGASLESDIERAALESARRLAKHAASPEPRSSKADAHVDTQTGLLALVRLSHHRKHELFTALTREWVPAGSELDALLGSVSALADQLRGRGGDASPELPVEIERKYLLASLPPRAKDVTPIEIDQGYLPGEQLHERLRRMRRDGDERWYRCVKLGRGIKRIEIEEETSREIYAKLWTLTKGRRVRKRRYEIEDLGRLWQIDEFLDRELFLLEVELPSEHEEVIVPDWLAPLVVREVTDDSSYVNLNLAR